MKINNILIPTDFSQEADNALDVAIEIANISKASVTLLHVVDVPSVSHYDSINGVVSSAETDPELYNLYTGSLKSVVKEKMRRIRSHYPDMSINEHVVFDSLHRHIADFVAKDETDLIVMGSTGTSGFSEIFVGSNTEKVIRLSKAPVLTIKKKEDGFLPKHIVFASTFQKVNTRTVDSLKSIQQLFDATLHLVKIITPNTFEATPYTIESIEEFAQQNKLDNFQVHAFNYFSEEEGIRAFAEYINADVISMTTHGRKGLSHLLLGSVAEEVANHSLTPVLTFNEHE